MLRDKQKKSIKIFYYALLREEAKRSQEAFQTTAKNYRELYEQLLKKYSFSLDPRRLKLSVNNCFVSWQTKIQDKDQVIFIPPVAGG